MKILKEKFGITQDSNDVFQYKLINNSGNYVTVLNYGATILSIGIKSQLGTLVDVCLGYNTIEAYEKNSGYLGACIGRVGNRIGNACFTLNGEEYKLAKNDGNNHLHGGLKGFNKCIFEVRETSEEIIFSRLSKDGEEGYPGNLKVEVSYSFDDTNQLTIRYFAVSDKDTPVNLTNHTYFNLSGEADGNILDHTMQIMASNFTEADEGCLPTGKFLSVEETPFDFREPKQIGKDIEADYIQLKNAGGYDHNFVLDGNGFRKVATVTSPKTNITMEVLTDKPGMQFYTGNFLSGQMGKSNTSYKKQAGFCLETQFFPNSLACSNFPSIILKAGQVYQSSTTYHFL